MKSLFVMDPLDHIHVAGDSTYALMRECTDRGHPVAYCTPDDLYVRDGEPMGAVTPVKVTADAGTILRAMCRASALNAERRYETQTPLGLDEVGRGDGVRVAGWVVGNQRNIACRFRLWKNEF